LEEADEPYVEGVGTLKMKLSHLSVPISP